MSNDDLEIVDLEAEDDGNVRIHVPLHMLQGNMDVLVGLYEQSEWLPVSGISLKQHDRGVVLMLHGDAEQKAEWAKLGFRTKNLSD